MILNECQQVLITNMLCRNMMCLVGDHHELDPLVYIFCVCMTYSSSNVVIVT